jgi:hypothetical protein
MKEKTAEINTLKGIRNDLDPERLEVGDLVSGVNVDLDDSGKPSRRLGYVRRISCTPKSIFGAGSYGYLLDGTNLKLFSPPSTLTTLRSGMASNKRISFVDLLGAVYYTNGEVTGKIENKVDKPWGISVPAIPAASVTIGSLRDGWYGYTTTYVRRNGQESGAKRMNLVKVLDNQGFTLSGIPVSSDPDVTHKYVYVTGRNGEVPMRVGTIPNNVTTFDYRHDVAGDVQVTTMFRGPPPSGHLLTYFKGSILIAQGDYLWHTDPFAPEQVDFRSNYIPLGEEATVLAPVESGLFVATRSRTLFLAGDSPGKFILSEVAAYGAPLGNAVPVDGSRITKDGLPKSCVGWMSDTGFCVGASDGTLTNLTQGRYIVNSAERAATTYKQRGGLTQFISVLFN